MEDAIETIVDREQVLTEEESRSPWFTNKNPTGWGNAKDVATAWANNRREREQRQDDEAIVVANDASQLATSTNEPASEQPSGYSEFNKSWKMADDDALRRHAYWVESRRREGLDPRKRQLFDPKMERFDPTLECGFKCKSYWRCDKKVCNCGWKENMSVILRKTKESDLCQEGTIKELHCAEESDKGFCTHAKVEFWLMLETWLVELCDLEYVDDGWPDEDAWSERSEEETETEDQDRY